MPGRWIAIGDIHGCATALRKLIATIVPTSEDVIVTLGDVLDRGPDSRGVIEQLIGLREQCVLKSVLGNHEEMFLAVIRREFPADRWIQFGGAATLDSYGFRSDLSVIPEEHVELLRSGADYLEAERHFFVHANYESHLPLAEQQPHWLRWLSLEETVPDPHFSGKIAIVGHTPDRSGEIFSIRHLKCIDTYCYGGGWLTALDISSGHVWQANEADLVREFSIGNE